ncbi:MAG TPA: hypothetical protein PK167_11655, partial [Prolixibacteraceae bacterium]|nr:hypothetical protein [Prolixibacteraceae bacterium]
MGGLRPLNDFTVAISVFYEIGDDFFTQQIGLVANFSLWRQKTAKESKNQHKEIQKYPKKWKYEKLMKPGTNFSGPARSAVICSPET